MANIEISTTMDAMLKSIVDVQQTQNKQIEDLRTMINGIRETMVTSLRFELHDSMMEAIKRGYTTSNEYDRIAEKMHDYTTNLMGNHGLSELYEDKYKKLEIR